MPDCAAEITTSAPRSAHAEAVLAALHELREVGMELARGLLDQPAAEAALAYSRIARAVRMTCALELRVAEEAADIRSSEQRTRAADEARALAAREQAGLLAKEDCLPILDEAMDEIEADIGEAQVERLNNACAEWLWDEEEDERFAAMSQAQVLESVCEALGVVPDPGLWAAGRYAAAIRAGILAAAPRPACPAPPWPGAPAAASDRLLDFADPP